MEEEKFTAYSRKLFSLGFGSLCLLLSLIFQSRAGFIRLAVHDHFSVAIVFILSPKNKRVPFKAPLNIITLLLFPF